MVLDTLSQFDRFSRDLFSTVNGTFGAPVDIRRDGERYVIDVDLPGVDPSAVDVTVEGSTLTISAERSDDRTDEGTRWVVRERSTSKVERRFTLGDDIDPAGIQAGYHNGVLSVMVPLAETAQHRKVPVAVGTADRKALAGSAADTTADEGKAPSAHSHAS
jgi:HSP20 family protein